MPEHRTPGVFIEEVPSGIRSITAVPTAVTAFVGGAPEGPLDEPVPLRSFAEYEQVFGGLAIDRTLGDAVRHFFANGGADALIVRVGGESGETIGFDQIAAPGLESQRRGLWALEKADHFNLLCIPPFAPDADVGVETWRAALAYCKRRRAVLLVDPPASWTSVAGVEDPVTGIDGTAAAVPGRDENAALYFPRVRLPDPLDGDRPAQFAPSGLVAGVIARTDASRGVWKAPAGVDAALAGVHDLAVPLTDAENGRLNPLAVNCLRVFPQTGAVVWGARTLAGDDRLASEWKYLPVRRLALFLEESIDRGTRWTVFEPNDEPLWAQIRSSAGAFLQDLFRRGAFQGQTAKEAYFVKCDRETTTQSDIDRGVVHLLVGFAPLKPAEFTVLRFELRARRP